MPELGQEVIGRDEESALLRDAVSQVLRGHKRAVLLFGPPGMGKTTLLRWAHDHAERSGLNCGSSRGVEVGGLPPRYLLTELLMGLASGGEPDLVQKKPAAPSELGPGPSPGRSPDVLSVAQALSAVAASGSVGLFVDDLQWVPRHDISLLFAAARIADVPVLIVGTERTGGPSGKSRTLPTELAADIPVSPISVTGLDAASVSHLAETILGGPVLPSLSEELYERTLGNPLFVTETLRTWQSNGDIMPLAGDHWGFADSGRRPDAKSLVEMISRRLRRVNRGVVEVATALAILGRTSTIEELAQFVRRLPGDIIGAIDQLDDAGVVSRDRDGHYRLAHPLYQSALLGDLNETQRARWHGVIYETLANVSSSTSSSELAYHAVNALRAPEHLDVLLLSAAKEAENVAGNVDAAHWYEHLVRISKPGPTLVRALLG